MFENLKIIKRQELNEKLEIICDGYRKNLSIVEEQYLFAFLNHIITSIEIEVNEIQFLSAAKKNYFKDSILDFDFFKMGELTKFMINYFSLKFLYKNRIENKNHFEEIIFNVFDFSDYEIKRYNYLELELIYSTTGFEKIFIELLSELFPEDLKKNPYNFAFLHSFIYNSFNAFELSFLKFFPKNIFG